MGETSTDALRARLAALVAGARASGVDAAEVAAILRAAADEVTSAADDPAPDEAAGPAPHQEPGEPGEPGESERTARIGPVTLFNEMDRLAAAGRRGWRVVASGTGMHLVTHTDQQWEFRRVLASPATGRALQAEGWQRFSAGWFPWGYYQRPTGRAPEPDDVVGGYVVEP